MAAITWDSTFTPWDDIGDVATSSSYLTLCNRVLRQMNEVELTSSTFASTRGFHSQVKDAINTAVREINDNEFEWPFNHVETYRELTIGRTVYPFPSNFKTVDLDTFQLMRDDVLLSAALRLRPILWEDYCVSQRDIDENTDSDGYAPPSAVYRTQNGWWGITPPPDKAYNVKYEYFLNPADMVDYDDTTTIPTSYDHVIVDGALHHCYLFRDNPEAAGAASKRFLTGIKKMRTLLINRYLSVSSTQLTRGGRAW